MSTQDTDYTIVIKGKPPEARQAAADYITLLLNPWRPDRSDKKTQVKIEVFRNEMHSRGFLEPVDLAKEAAEYFPGSNITVEGKSECGNVDEQFQEEGTLSEAAVDLVAEKVLTKLKTLVDSDTYRHQWIEPLSEWSANVTLGKGLINQIKDQFEITVAAVALAQEEKRLAKEKEARELLEKQKASRKFIQEKQIWNFNPITPFEGEKLGNLGKPSVVEEMDWDGTPKEEATYKILLAIRITESSPFNKIILDESKNSLLLYIKKPKGILSSVTIGKDRILNTNEGFYWQFESGIELENLEYKTEIAELLSDSAELWVSNSKYQKLPNLTSPILADNKGLYVVSQFDSELYLLKLSQKGELTQSIPTGMDSQWFFCMDQDRFYISGSRASSDEDPYCISAFSKDGSRAWRIDLAIDPSASYGKKDFCKIMGVSPSILVYCLGRSNKSSYDPKNLVAIDPTNGSRLWDREVNQPSAVVMDGSRIYVADATHIHCFDYQGMVSWSEKLPAIALEPDSYTNPVDGLSLDGAGTLFVTLKDKGLLALNVEDGKAQWITELEKAGSPSVVDAKGRCYLAFAKSRDEDIIEVHAFDAKSGSRLWQSQVAGSTFFPINAPLVTTKGLLIHAEESLNLFDFNNGTVIWSVTVDFLDRSRGIVSDEGNLLLQRGVLPRSGYMDSNKSIVCIKGDFGTLSGPWPIAGGNGANSNYLPTAKKAGFKEFISDWREGKPVAPRLARLNPEFNNDSQIGSHVHGIIRGRELLKNAREWAEPEIGQGPSAKYRGLQWKLVMAYSGIELLVKSLAAMGMGGLGPKEMADLITKLPLPAFEPIPSPSLEKSSIKAWIEELDQDAVLDFLKTDKGDRSQMQSWLLDQKPCTTWTDALLLAKALRNCTAHGALSPNKVQVWGLSEAFKQLPQALFKIDAAIFEVLGS